MLDENQNFKWIKLTSYSKFISSRKSFQNCNMYAKLYNWYSYSFKCNINYKTYRDFTVLQKREKMILQIYYW